MNPTKAALYSFFKLLAVLPESELLQVAPEVSDHLANLVGMDQASIAKAEPAASSAVKNPLHPPAK